MNHRSIDRLLEPAVFSDCMQYRYYLRREFSEDDIRPCVFVMLNPSTADHTKNDPTIRRCIGYAKAWWCSSLVVVNIFALRATNPKELRRHPSPVGSSNFVWLQAAMSHASLSNGLIVCAWGASGAYMKRGWEVQERFKDYPLHHLGLTQKGEPKHPLYLKKSLKPILWSAE